ncbi:MAG: phospholipid-binding protein [Oscillatoria princeps RMCB-10]|jgi:hypothetical protein|nr:phospholipid-binding protein [Oscillatoria princeps RMCB-10]
MGWLQRLFGVEKPKTEGSAAVEQPAPAWAQTLSATCTALIPPERVGLNGEYDPSGLAKRVVLAFERDAEVEDIKGICVAQLGSTVVLAGRVANQQILTQLVAIASRVSGATGVQTERVTIGAPHTHRRADTSGLSGIF